jgi:hypothetical protein
LNPSIWRIHGEPPHLFKIPVDGGTPILLVNEYSTDPT